MGITTGSNSVEFDDDDDDNDDGNWVMYNVDGDFVKYDDDGGLVECNDDDDDDNWVENVDMSPALHFSGEEGSISCDIFDAKVISDCEILGVVSWVIVGVSLGVLVGATVWVLLVLMHGSSLTTGRSWNGSFPGDLNTISCNFTISGW